MDAQDRGRTLLAACPAALWAVLLSTSTVMKMGKFTDFAEPSTQPPPASQLTVSVTAHSKGTDPSIAAAGASVDEVKRAAPHRVFAMILNVIIIGSYMLLSSGMAPEKHRQTRRKITYSIRQVDLITAMCASIRSLYSPLAISLALPRHAQC